MPTPVGRSVIAALVLVCVVGQLAACHSRSSTSTPARKPNVVLISIDTLRPDRLSTYGNTNETSPTLTTLARTGVRFDNAYSVSSWTAPAVVSLLTSVLPIRHGVTHGAIVQRAALAQETIPDGLPTLAETLRGHGYRTLGIAANPHLAGEFGFARGFDRYTGLSFVDADEVMTIVRTWKADLDSGAPYFAWVHFLDPHEPYQPRDPWLTQFLAGRPRRPELENLPAHGYEPMHLDAERIDYVKTVYDSEIRYTDDRVADLLTELRVTNDDLVIVVSDHGEEFGEHEFFAHGSSLFEASVRIPLIVRFPREEFARRTVAEYASILDVFPTIAEVAGIPAVPDLDGVSLLAGLRGASPAARPILLQLSRRGLDLRAVIRDPWKLTVRGGPGAETTLFNLREDPGERVDRLARDVAAADELKGILEARLDTGAPVKTVGSAPKEMSPRQIEALKALGYVQ